jgi:hypothetical protein
VAALCIWGGVATKVSAGPEAVAPCICWAKSAGSSGPDTHDGSLLGVAGDTVLDATNGSAGTGKWDGKGAINMVEPTDSVQS